MNVVALIPLRAGGSRVGKIKGLDKERAVLGKHPLMAYTIRWAMESGIFDSVIAVVRSKEHQAIAEEYGAQVPMLRPPHTTKPDSPDIDWVFWIMRKYWEEYQRYSHFSILRVTSPFRTAEDIKTAWELYKGADGADSLRTVTKVSQHPGKMWLIRQGRLLPLLPMGPDNLPWHSRATQQIFDCYTQTAGMEFANTKKMLHSKTIAGSVVVPYVVDGLAALDINDKFDWYQAEQAVKHGLAPIPESLK